MSCCYDLVERVVRTILWVTRTLKTMHPAGCTMPTPFSLSMLRNSEYLELNQNETIQFYIVSKRAIQYSKLLSLSLSLSFELRVIGICRLP